MAREPMPWLEFVKQYTYPVIYSTTNQVYANTDPQEAIASCVADALASEGKQLGEDILDEVFNLGDAIAYQFNKNLCHTGAQRTVEMEADLGLIWDPDKRDEVPLEKMAKMQAFYDVGDDATLAFCGALTNSVDSIEELWEHTFDKIKFCGMTELMIGSVQCLFSGMTFEAAMSTVLESALRAMSLESFDKLFVGLPADKQSELDALVKKKLESGELFHESSDLQITSDVLSGKLDYEKPFENEAMKQEQNATDLQADPPATTKTGELTPGSGSSRPERTLASRLDGGLKGA